MKIDDKINNYLLEAKKISLEKVAKAIVNNIQINYKISEYVDDYFEGDIPLSGTELAQLNKKIATKLIKDIKSDL